MLYDDKVQRDVITVLIRIYNIVNVIQSTRNLFEHNTAGHVYSIRNVVKVRTTALFCTRIVSAVAIIKPGKSARRIPPVTNIIRPDLESAVKGFRARFIARQQRVHYGRFRSTDTHSPSSREERNKKTQNKKRLSGPCRSTSVDAEPTAVNIYIIIFLSYNIISVPYEEVYVVTIRD